MSDYKPRCVGTKPLVIFVGGTSYSGTTFFHMILGNDPAGIAVGEVRWLFNPTQPYHIRMRCTCDDPQCGLWKHLKSRPEAQLFPSLIEYYPGTRFVVDSSKSVFWTAKQSRMLNSAGIETRHILIWKTPEEFFASKKRRNRLKGWDSMWANYHRLYFSLIQNWRAIPYADLVHDPDTLRSTCEWLGIDYFDTKQEYWHKTQHIFGGNQTSRFHLYSGSAATRELKDSFDEDRMEFHRKIYYSNSDAHEVSLDQLLAPRKVSALNDIVETLQANDVRSATASRIGPALPKSEVAMRSLKQRVEHGIGWLKYGWRKSEYS